MSSGICSTCGISFDEIVESCDLCGFGNSELESMNENKVLDFHVDENRLNEIQPEGEDHDDNDK
ncbi:MAG: hypothetical protein KAS32_27690 [Candidatus Peribacteraceae bacterium]|nr:hypothetical protein [Candidatus Peribacteraceae bacterium]